MLTGKHLCCILFLTKLQTLQAFNVNDFLKRQKRQERINSSIQSNIQPGYTAIIKNQRCQRNFIHILDPNATKLYQLAANMGLD